MRSCFLLALFIPVATAAPGSLVVLGSTIELPAPALCRAGRAPRLLAPTLVASCQRALDPGEPWPPARSKRNPRPIARWAVRSAPRSAPREALLQRRDPLLRSDGTLRHRSVSLSSPHLT